MSGKLRFCCGRKKQCPARSHTPTQRSLSIPGREVIHGKLWMRKGRKAKMTKVEVVVFCGTQEPEIAGRLEIVDESARSCQKLRIVSFADVKLDFGVKTMLPCLSSYPIPTQHSHRGISFHSQSANQTTFYPFQIVLRSDEVVEFFHTNEDSRQQWTKRLGLLFMFPYSPIPDEPTINPAMRNLFQTKIDHRNFKADSVWGVYILPEEVGARTHTVGLNFLALTSYLSEDQQGRIDVVSPMETHPRIQFWHRSLVRRVGHLGNLSFIEIGRRCTGGPGLLWLYPGPEKAEALQCTLHRFLYEGDACCLQGEGSGTQSTAVFSDGSNPSIPPNPTIVIDKCEHQPDGMSCIDIFNDCKDPSPIVSWKEEDEEICVVESSVSRQLKYDRQRRTLQRWAQSGAVLGRACSEHCPEDH